MCFQINQVDYRTRANYADSIKKLFFYSSTIMNFVKFCLSILYKTVQKSEKMPIFGFFQGAATIQERPLLAWLRYLAQNQNLRTKRMTE